MNLLDSFMHSVILIFSLYVQFGLPYEYVTVFEVSVMSNNALKNSFNHCLSRFMSLSHFGASRWQPYHLHCPVIYRVSILLTDEKTCDIIFLPSLS